MLEPIWFKMSIAYLKILIFDKSRISIELYVSEVGSGVVMPGASEKNTPRIRVYFLL